MRDVIRWESKKSCHRWGSRSCLPNVAAMGATRTRAMRVAGYINRWNEACQLWYLTFSFAPRETRDSRVNTE